MWKTGESLGSLGSRSSSSGRSSAELQEESPSADNARKDLGRSRSFGFLAGKNSGHGFRTGTWSGGGVLGEGYGSPGVSRRLLSSLGGLAQTTVPTGPEKKGSLSVAVKNPRPTKTRAVLESLIAGLEGSIRLAEEEMGHLKSSISDLSLHSQQSQQGRIYGLEKCSKSSDRYLKRLEYHMSLVEELGEEYSLQQKLREGVRSMAYAYSLSTGREKENALASVKAGFKECTQVLAGLETRLQTMLGTFKMEIKGIQGFSRLCGGDVFEICLKHGVQKWRSRGRVGRDGVQTWDLPRASFRGVLSEVIQIKAAEVKTLGKQVLLGNKFCEISDLFSPHPQLMTVNLNPSGSLKLQLLVNWCPIDVNADGTGSVRSLSLSVIGSLSPNRKRRLSPFDQSNSSTLSSSQSEADVEEENRVDALWERSIEAIQEPTIQFPPTPSKSPRLQTEADSVSENVCLGDPSGNFSFGQNKVLPTMEEEECIMEESLDPAHTEKDVRGTLIRLSALLEDIQGQFTETEALETHVAFLKNLAKSPCFRGSSSSLNVESALECFDFLDREDESETKIYSVVKSNRGNHTNNIEIMDGKMTRRTTDSGISFDESRSPSPLFSLNQSPQPPLSGSSQLDGVLQAHLFLSLQLIHRVGSFGPLRCGERKALRKLQEQGTIIGYLLLRIQGQQLQNGARTGIEELWERISDSGAGERLLLTPEEAAAGLEKEIKPILSQKFSKEYAKDKVLLSKVAQRLLVHILDTDFSPEDTLTLYQFEMALKHETSFTQLTEDLTNEEILLDELREDDRLVERLKGLLPKRCLPPKNVLLLLIRLLKHKDEEVINIVQDFLKSLSNLNATKREVEEVVAEMLESEDGVEREAGAIGLGLIGGRGFLEELAYVAQMDELESVREGARGALSVLGEDSLLHQLTLSTHGFQGLVVH